MRPNATRCVLHGVAIAGCLLVLSPPAAAVEMGLAIQAAVRAHAQAWSTDRRWLAQYAGATGGDAFSGHGAAAAPTSAADMIAFTNAILADAASPTADDSPACRQPWRHRLLNDQLRTVGLTLPTAPPCPSLARFEDTRQIELLFVAPSGERASAGFGHLLIRLRGSDRTRDDVTFEVSALTGTGHTGLAFLYRGITGGFPLVFEAQSLQSVLHENRVREQRSLQRFALNLTADQRRRVLDLLWQSERELVAPYRFFSRNCATYVLWLLETALDGHPMVAGLSPVWISPAEAIDRLAAVTMPHNAAPLLYYVPGSFQSTAAQVPRARNAANRALQAVVDDPRLSRNIAAQWPQWRNMDGVGLATLVRQTLDESPSQTTTIAAILLGEVAQRRADMDRVAAAVEQMDLGRLQPIAGEPPPDVATLLAWRNAYYAHEDNQWRSDRKLEQIATVESYLRRAPRLPVSSVGRALLAEAAQVQARFVRATDTYAAVADVIDVTPAAAVEAQWDEAHRVAEVARWGDRVLAGPGGGVGLGAVWLNHAGARGMWAAILTSTLWREELGQWRQTGLGPRTALVAADLQTQIGIERGLPRWQGTRGRLLQFARNAEMPFISNWLRSGWGASVNVDLQPRQYAIAPSVDGRLLVADGVETPWTAGVAAYLGPTARVGDVQSIDLVAKIESFLHRLVAATGRFGAVASAQSSFHDRFCSIAGVADVPLDSREVWRIRGQFGWRCTASGACVTDAALWLQR